MTIMISTASRLESIIEEMLPLLEQVPGEAYQFKPSPTKWSKKEILGHLIDSAQNNIRRFITAQYEDKPYIVYNQDSWVRINGYQQWDARDIIRLWAQLNKQVITILRNTDPVMYQRPCQTQDEHSLEWLADDYVKHLLHHLHVILELEPVTYP
jgi:hypothetical protein